MRLAFALFALCLPLAACDTPRPGDKALPVLTVAVGSVSAEARFGDQPVPPTCPDGSLAHIPATVQHPRYVLLLPGAARTVDVDFIAAQGSGVVETVISLPTQSGQFLAPAGVLDTGTPHPIWRIITRFPRPGTLTSQTVRLAPIAGSDALPLLYQASGASGATSGDSFTILFDATAC